MLENNCRKEKDTTDSAPTKPRVSKGKDFAGHGSVKQLIQFRRLLGVWV